MQTLTYPAITKIKKSLVSWNIKARKYDVNSKNACKDFWTPPTLPLTLLCTNCCINCVIVISKAHNPTRLIQTPVMNIAVDKVSFDIKKDAKLIDRDMN